MCGSWFGRCLRDLPGESRRGFLLHLNQSGSGTTNISRCSGIQTDSFLPMSEPCNDSASRDRCLWTSMKTGIRSPGLYWIGTVDLEW